MSESSSGSDPLLQLAEEFAERFRRGERPALTEYTDKYPEMAAEIRDLFPAMVVMEEFGSVGSPATGPYAKSAAKDGSAPRQLGEYRILREVARGGMGIVYEAVQESLGRHVALKVLPVQSLLNPHQLERFRREARAAAQLHHTNIVPVFGVGEADGIHYYAMQFIQGQSLDSVLHELQRLRRYDAGRQQAPGNVREHSELSLCIAEGMVTGQFAGNAECRMMNDERKEEPSSSSFIVHHSTLAATVGAHSELTAPSEAQFFRSVAHVGVQVADALAYAHQQGVLHRDIKPSNLLLDTQGTVWITDFGLAKAEGTDELTSPGDIIGTLRYMSPERFSGQADPRSDVYSLGLTLHEMLTLEPAFTASQRAQLIERVLRDEPARPRKLDPRIPRDLETIVLKAIAKEPGQRYASASALAEDLRRFLVDRPIQARRSSWRERIWRWCRRNPVVAGLSAAVSLLLLALGTGFLITELLRAERDQALAAQKRAESAELRARDAEQEIKVREHLALATAHRRSRQPGQRFQSLAEIAKAMELNPAPQLRRQLRNEAIAALALQDIHITQEWADDSPDKTSIDLSDDFALYVRTTDKGVCTVHQVADSAQVARLPELGEPAHAQFGPGRILAVHGTSSGRFQLWDVSGGEPALRFEERAIDTWGFHPDGRLVAIAHGDGSISVYDVATRTRLRRLEAKEKARGPALRFHPTEPFLATSSYFSRVVRVYDLRTGAVAASALPPWPRGNGGSAWSPDGRTLTVPDGNSGKIQQYAFDPAAPALRPTRLLDGPVQGGAHIVYNPAGDQFVSRGWSNTVNLFDAVSGQLLFSTHSLPATSDYHWLRFDRTGQRLAGARVGERSERIGLWSVADAREYRYLVHTGSGVSDKFGPYSPAIHPRGRLAAVGFIDGVALFDLDTGNEVRYLPISDNRGRTVAFDGKGSLLTNGFEGFFRWPVRSNAADPGRLFVGPSERLPFHPGHRDTAASHDGRVIAQCMWGGYGMSRFAGGWILHPNSPEPRWLDPGQSMFQCSVSPDGRWVAFGLHTNRVKVYDAATGECVWQSPAGKGNCCQFTPDGCWLVTDVDGGHVYAVGTWEPGPQLGPGTPWDATSELVVLGQPNGIYRLVELATGRELARLEDPEQNARAAAFTPDGTKLVVGAKNGLRVWDLRRIREELSKLGLDWEAPSYPPAPAPRNEPPLEVTVDLGDLSAREKYSLVIAFFPFHAEAYYQRGLAYRRFKQTQDAFNDFTMALSLKPDHARAHYQRALLHAGRYQATEAVADFTRAMALEPGHADAFAERTQADHPQTALDCNNLAWYLATCPEAKFRDAKRAIALAKKAVALAPKEGDYWNTLGVALYRADTWKEAIEALEKAMVLQSGGNGFDFFFLAMAHWQLGNKDKARKWQQRAVAWLEEHPKRVANEPQRQEELRRFRDEAAMLIKP